MMPRRDDGATISEQAYQELLRLYPKKFRREYGSQMEQVFGDLCRKERQRRGARGLAALWLRTLSDLAASVAFERSTQIGDAIVGIRKLATLRNLMLFNGALFLAFGIVFFNAAPVHVFGLATVPVDWQDPSEYATIAMGRLAGTVCLGFGALLLAISRVAEMFARQAVSGALFATNALGTFSLLGVQIAMWERVAGWISVSVHLFFATGYGLIWFKGSLAGALAEKRTPAQSGESC